PLRARDRCYFEAILCGALAAAERQAVGRHITVVPLYLTEPVICLAHTGSPITLQRLSAAFHVCLPIRLISGARMKPVHVLLVLLCAPVLLLACASQPASTPASNALTALETAQAYLQRGDNSAERHDYERAIADYTQAIHLQPDYAEAYNNRGYAYYWQGQYPNAIADYDRAIALRPLY